MPDDGLFISISFNTMAKVFRSDVAIAHFPAGEVSRRYQGKVQDCAWQKSLITRAISSQRDIVPFYFHGRNSSLFYGINLIRRALGITTNIELMLLPRELFLKRNQNIRLVIGQWVLRPLCEKQLIFEPFQAISSY